MSITCKQIAEMVGVSRQAAASVLNNAPKCLVSQEKKLLIQKIAQELNYVHNNAARTLRKGKSGMIGILSGGLHIKRTGFTLITIDKELRTSGFLPVIIYTRSEYDCIVAGIHSLLQQNVEGLIINGITPPAAADMILRLKQQGLLDMVPTIVTNCNHACDTDTVNYQYDGVIDTILLRMTEKNFTSLVPMLRSKKRDVCESGEAIRELVKRSAIPAAPEIEIEFPQPLSSDRFKGDIMQNVRTALQKYHQGTLFLCDTGFCAIQTVSTLLQQYGKLPEHTAVIAFDLTENCNFFSPGITAVELNFDLFAQKCCDLLKRRIKSPAAVHEQLDIQADLVIRETF